MKAAALPWLFEVTGKKKLNILMLTLLQALQGAAGVLYALFLRGLVDAAAGHDSTGFGRNLAFLTCLVLIQLALQAVIRWLAEFSRSSLENIFKRRLMQTLLHRDLLRVSAVHSGEWMNRLTNDAKVVADRSVEILPGFAGMTVKLISALLMILVMEPLFAAVLIPGGLVMAVFSWFFRRRLKMLHRKVQEADGRLRVFLQERIGNLFIIRSFAAEEKTMEDTELKMSGHQEARMQRIVFSSLVNIGFSAAMRGMYLLGAAWCGYGILKGTVSFGTLTAITQLIAQIQTPFANITGYLPRYYAMLASAERLMEVEDFEGGMEEVLSLDEAAEFYKSGLSSIGLEDVCFAYYPSSEGAGRLSKEGMPAALDHVSLEIRKGETIAFTGQSGCGKSTALKLLMCIYGPDSGRRYFKDKSGIKGDLTAACRRLFAYVPQGNALMNGTIREVVSFGAPEMERDEARLAGALKVSCADEFVSELAGGADTLLGERGMGLSEGQMQRLAIARAVFSGSPILLLDEATSALDAETERRLLQNLKAMTDRTVVIVTHRPAALEICDGVLEFTERGVISHVV